MLPNTTILSITKDNQNILGYEEIILMDAGTVLEKGDPVKLLKKESYLYSYLDNTDKDTFMVFMYKIKEMNEPPIIRSHNVESEDIEHKSSMNFNITGKLSESLQNNTPNSPPTINSKKSQRKVQFSINKLNTVHSVNSEAENPQNRSDLVHQDPFQESTQEAPQKTAESNDKLELQ